MSRYRKFQKTNFETAITSACAAMRSQTIRRFNHKNLCFYNVEPIWRDRFVKSPSEEKRKKGGTK